MRIQHNILAMNAYRNYTNNTSALGKNLEKLSSGYKINRAGDDAAGLAISEKMRAQITGLNAASKNVKDGISLVKTAEGAMQEVQDMLNRMVYLATQSANGTYDNDTDRAALQKEIVQLKEEINRIADSANFNGINLLDGTAQSSSISALQGLLPDLNINGTNPSAGGNAMITLNMGGGDAPEYEQVEASVDKDETYDGKEPSAAVQETASFTIGEDTTIGGTNVLDSTGAGGAALTYKDLADALGDEYTFTVNGADYDAAKNAGTDFEEGDEIVITAKAPGATSKELEDIIKNAVGWDYTQGINEGEGAPATKAKYEFELDLAQLEGGQTFTLNGGTIYVNTEDSGSAPSGMTILDISTLNLDDLAGEEGDGGLADIAAALQTALGTILGSDGTAKVEYDADTGHAKITITGANAGAANDLGELAISTNSGKTPLVEGSYKHTAAADAKDGVEGKFAKVTFTDDKLKLDTLKVVGAKFKFGDLEFEVVEDDDKDEANGKISVDDINAGKIQALLAQAFGPDYNVTYNGTNGEITLEATVAKSGMVDDMKKLTIEVAEAPELVTAKGGTIGDIVAGTTTLQDILNRAVGSTGLKVKDLFDVTVDGKTNGDYVVKGDSQIVFEAKQNGKLSDEVMNAVAGYTEGASVEKRDGWDEGQTGAGKNTHYGITIDTDLNKMVGGATFSFGTGANAVIFELSFDDGETNNGEKKTEDGSEEVGSKDRVVINLSSKMKAKDIADEIKEKVQTALGSSFNVKTTISSDGKITLEADATEGTSATNYGGVRYSSKGGAFSGAEYRAFNAFDEGTEGTYAQVTYDFDPSKLKSGDTVTIGGITINVGDKTETVKDGDTIKSITLKEEDAQNAEKLIAAFESAGFKSGQLEISGGKMTIIGTEVGQKAEDLAKAMGVSLTSTRSLYDGGLILQIGDTSETYNQLRVSIGDMHTKAMGIDGIDVSTSDQASDAINVIKNAINYVSGVRGDLGATQNRLEHTQNNLSVMAENIQDAESTIRDTDVAEEMMSYVKNNILIQSAQAMLAQANQVPQGVLQLLG